MAISLEGAPVPQLFFARTRRKYVPAPTFVAVIEVRGMALANKPDGEAA